MKPIIIDSSIEFVLVGPIRSNDGILLQSLGASSDLIGIANLLYRSNQEKEISAETDYFRFLWGDILSKSGRKQKILLCWFTRRIAFSQSKEENAIEYYLNISEVIKLQKRDIYKTFNAFIEDAYSILYNLVEGETYQGILYDVAKSQLQWYISPLLLSCHFENPEATFVTWSNR